MFPATNGLKPTSSGRHAPRTASGVWGLGYCMYLAPLEYGSQISFAFPTDSRTPSLQEVHICLLGHMVPEFFVPTCVKVLTSSTPQYREWQTSSIVKLSMKLVRRTETSVRTSPNRIVTTCLKHQTSNVWALKATYIYSHIHNTSLCAYTHMHMHIHLHIHPPIRPSGHPSTHPCIWNLYIQTHIRMYLHAFVVPSYLPTELLTQLALFNPSCK